MQRLGYRVVSSREYERSALGITYFKVTYELVEPVGINNTDSRLSG
jgi:hypothetical protein